MSKYVKCKEQCLILGKYSTLLTPSSTSLTNARHPLPRVESESDWANHVGISVAIAYREISLVLLERPLLSWRLRSYDRFLNSQVEGQLFEQDLTLVHFSLQTAKVLYASYKSDPDD